ncbi:MAG: cytochrome P460 family protein, partial [Calditrichia bacterium]
MKNLFKRLSYVGVVLFLVAAFWVSESASEQAQIAYPEGYRDWTHVKSMVLQPGHALYESFGGIHHIYANETALKAMKSGKSYPDGSVIVFDLLE